MTRKKWTRLAPADRLRLAAAVVRGETYQIKQTLTDVALAFDVSRETATHIMREVLAEPPTHEKANGHRKPKNPNTRDQDHA